MTVAKGRRCSKPGCEEKHWARGLCHSHYSKAHSRGELPPRQLELGIHSLSSIDRVARTADCLICGPAVPIRVRHRPGNGGGVECGIKYEEQLSRRRQKWRMKKLGVAEYRLTRDEHERMVADQQGRCAICQSEPDRLVIDHDHETGAVRGLLCHMCNIGIGFLRDDAGIVASAARYLTDHAYSKTA